MPPFVALMVWLVLLLALLRFDPARVPTTSFALWLPVTWMFIVASRLPSQWLGGSIGSAAQAFEEGNSLDRSFFLILIALAVAVLVSRSFQWLSFFTQNLALTAFLFFALLSVLWSDFPFVSLKRWFRDLGHYVMILVVLTDPVPLEAVRTVFRRVSFLLLPLSILLIKYFPAIGMQYSVWTGEAMYVGPTMGKNTLGAICLVGGLFFFWDTVTRWPLRKEWESKRIILLNLFFMAMAILLLRKAHSATSMVCLALGCLVVAAVHSGWGRRHPTLLKVAIPMAFLTYLLLAFGFQMNGFFATTVGRDPSLTDRTYIWQAVLGLHTNPLVGTGYESFWLGPRLTWLWQQSVTSGINEAHNGWLEIYLNLGLIGAALICCLLIASYRNVCKRLTSHSKLASFGLALWTITLFYNMTEAAFKWHIMWVTFLTAALVVPDRSQNNETPVVPIRKQVRSQQNRTTGRDRWLDPVRS
jgi:exopolysaccharide production protein ExoQ